MEFNQISRRSFLLHAGAAILLLNPLASKISKAQEKPENLQAYSQILSDLFVDRNRVKLAIARGNSEKISKIAGELNSFANKTFEGLDIFAKFSEKSADGKYQYYELAERKSRENKRGQCIDEKTFAIEKIVFKYINAKRRKAGLPELEYDDALAEVAREHSIGMAFNSSMGHYNLRNEGPNERAQRHNYTIKSGTSPPHGIGENIARLPTGCVVSVLGYFVQDTAEDAGFALVDLWMKSPHHRANILDNLPEVAGIGVSKEAVIYYVGSKTGKISRQGMQYAAVMNLA
ncbi:MAG: CAP domain-containing protein [Candidatus Micrarchaeota archaeon]